MKDKKNRDMMAQLYRIVEKYEEPPSLAMEESEPYFKLVVDELTAFYNEYNGNEFAKAFSLAFYDAIAERVKRVNKWEG